MNTLNKISGAATTWWPCLTKPDQMKLKWDSSNCTVIIAKWLIWSKLDPNLCFSSPNFHVAKCRISGQSSIPKINAFFD